MPKDDLTKKKYQVPESLEFKGNATKIGAKTSHCLELQDLAQICLRGFTPRQWAHTRKCKDCIVAYSHYLKLRRAEARDRRGLSLDMVPLPDMDRLK